MEQPKNGLFLAYGTTMPVLDKVFVFPSTANTLATSFIFVFYLKTCPLGKVKTFSYFSWRAWILRMGMKWGQEDCVGWEKRKDVIVYYCLPTQLNHSSLSHRTVLIKLKIRHFKTIKALSPSWTSSQNLQLSVAGVFFQRTFFFTYKYM